jgi:hypothetical protein
VRAKAVSRVAVAAQPLMRFAFDVVDNPGSFKNAKKLLGKFSVDGSEQTPGGHIRYTPSVAACAASLRKLIGGVQLTEINRLLKQGGHKPDHFTTSGEAYAPRKSAEKKLAMEVAIHALAEAEEAGTVPN